MLFFALKRPLSEMSTQVSSRSRATLGSALRSLHLDLKPDPNIANMDMIESRLTYILLMVRLREEYHKGLYLDTPVTSRD